MTCVVWLRSVVWHWPFKQETIWLFHRDWSTIKPQTKTWPHDESLIRGFMVNIYTYVLHISLFLENLWTNHQFFFVFRVISAHIQESWKVVIAQKRHIFQIYHIRPCFEEGIISPCRHVALKHPGDIVVGQFQALAHGKHSYRWWLNQM